jgi:hypothetical protein
MLGACNTPLERYFQEISSNLLKAPNFLKFHLVNQKKQICSLLVTVDQGGKKNHNEPAALFYHVFYYTK